MRSFKEGVNFIKETKNEAVAEAMTAIYCPSEKQKKIVGAYIGTGTVLGMIVPVLADANDLQNAINAMFKKAFGWIFGITTALAALLILIAFIQYMIASDPQTSSMAKNRIIKIIFAWVAINCIGGIISALEAMAKKGNVQYDYNK